MITLKLKPGMDGTRVRETPVDGTVLLHISDKDIVTSLESDDVTLDNGGIEYKWLNIKTEDGVTGYVAAWLLEVEGGVPIKKEVPEAPATGSVSDYQSSSPTVIEIDGKTYVTVSPTENNLRMRAEPATGKKVGSVSKNDVLAALEDIGTVRDKIGVKDEWLYVQTLYGQKGYIAAWFVEPYTGEIPEVGEIPEAANITGVNLDIHHPLGKPDPSMLAGLGWVRLGYDVSAGKGSTDIDAAFNSYQPYIEKCVNAGLKVMLCFTHETYGEGRNEYWPWPSMTTEKWKDLTGYFTEMIGRIVKQYAGKNLVHAYQVWNEMDAPIGAAASVPMLAKDYAIILGATIKTIKAIDPTVAVITGGHTGGPGRGGQYAIDTIKALPSGVLPDGIAFHPYGRGVTQPAEPYSIFGHIDDSMRAYQPILPGRPVWITEWGVLDRENDNSADILDYAEDMVQYIKSAYPGQVATMIWYAWAMSMHNGYGMVDRSANPIQPLNDGFRKL